MELPLVHVVATGGTIANTSGGRLPIEQVMDVVPELGSLARFEVTHTSRVGSAELRPSDWLEIARTAATAAADDRVAAVVVTHGTFTNEETAWFLHLTVRTEKPIVVVSSQRKHDELGNDGNRNLLDAVRLAVSSEARGHGAMTLLNEDVHSARDVVKTSSRPDGFRSRDVGVLGHVDKDRVVFYRKALRRHTAASEFDATALTELPRVDVVYAYPGADELTIDPLVDGGARGIVVAGYAFSGMPAVDQLPALDRAVAGGVAVVLANRAIEGRVPDPPEDSRSAGRGFLHGDNLSPHKARILTMLGLAHGLDHSNLQRLFDEY
jgi:L-asparaginase type II